MNSFRLLHVVGGARRMAWGVLLLAAMGSHAEVIFFEGARDGEIPSGWTAEGTYPQTAAQGYWRITNHTGWVATPTLDLSGYTDVQLSFNVAKFGTGDNGPLTVQVSTNGGASWDAMEFDSPTPISSTYSNSGPHTLVHSSATRIRWTSVNSPSQKRLRDLLLTGDPVASEEEIPSEIRAQGFEGSALDFWSYERVPGDGRVAISMEERGQTGIYALQLTGSEDGASNPYVVFDNVDLAGLSNVTFSMGFAARGVDNHDNLYVDFSYDNGVSWPDSVQLMNGFNNFNLDFGETDADRTVDENPVTLEIDDLHEQVRVRVRFDEAAGQDNRFDHYYIDDLRLTADGDQPWIRFGQSELVVEEGAGSAMIPVVISEPADATVHVRVSGPAHAAADFSIASTTLTFSASGSTTNAVELTIHDDALPRGPRFAHFTLEQAAGGRLLAPGVATLVIRDNRSMTVMAANLPSGTNTASGDFPYDEASKRIFRLLRPDVVAIQEWILLPGETLAEFVDQHVGSGFDYFIESASFPNGVISRWPIVDAGVWVDDEIGNRDFVWATIDLPSDRNLHIVSVHLKAGHTVDDREMRIRQARALTNYMAQASFPTNDYLVVAGDLNLAGRNEETLDILGAWVTDESQPADQEGTRQTNIPRNQHYDFVLPNSVLEADHIPLPFDTFTFPDGLVFDSRLWGDHLLPVRVGDSADINMQHLAVMKLFSFPESVLAPASFDAIGIDASTVELSWTSNVEEDAVVLVYNQTGHFGIPDGSPPAPGQPFSGGTLLYHGSSDTFLHEDRSGCVLYSYALWSVNESDYSSPRLASAAPLPPAVPTDVVAVTAEAFAAEVAWEPVAGITEYRLDVSPFVDFQIGGEGPAKTNQFEDIAGTPTSSYLTRTWTAAGVDWTAYKARTDQDVDGASAITFQNEPGSYMVSEPIAGGIGALEFQHQQKFSGSGGSLEVFVNDVRQAEFEIQSTVQTAVISGIHVSGPFTLMISNNAAVRPALAELAWTAYQEEVPAFVDGYEGRPVTGTSAVVTGLTANATYFVRVRAGQESCSSESSSVASFETAMDPHQDTDGDGIPDWWEELYFGGPTAAVATNQAANSVNTVLESYIADLDPTDADEVLLLDGSSAALDAYWFHISPTSTGRVYDLYWRTDLFEGDWLPMGFSQVGTGGELALPVTNAVPNSFWRVGVRLP